MKTWTVKDLLYKTFEFREMVPNSNEWNESSLKYNEPRLIRFRRLNALLKAFGLTRTKKQKNSLWTMLSGKKIAKEDELTKNNTFFAWRFHSQKRINKISESSRIDRKRKIIRVGSF
ncbi:hypothetical protein ACXIHB_05635 [Tenacibaculum sp. IMCC1]|uniref:Uncharacterized protein n=1 Tax=Tenacibaculum sp. Pbs-1 TaxID=3238748 RepID=A0AB33KYQ9_9FLAO